MSAKKPSPKKTQSTHASTRPTWHGRPIPADVDVPDPPLKDLPRTFMNWPRLGILGLVRLYQATFSHALPVDSCRFYPSCSHYGYQAIYKYGVIKGGLMAAWRILRCNPLNPGGFDPVH